MIVSVQQLRLHGKHEGSQKAQWCGNGAEHGAAGDYPCSKAVRRAMLHRNAMDERVSSSVSVMMLPTDSGTDRSSAAFPSSSVAKTEDTTLFSQPSSCGRAGRRGMRVVSGAGQNRRQMCWLRTEKGRRSGGEGPAGHGKKQHLVELCKDNRDGRREKLSQSIKLRARGVEGKSRVTSDDAACRRLAVERNLCVVSVW